MKQFHVSFKKWIDNSTVNWDDIMDEDKAYDYRMSQKTSTETESIPSASKSPINTDYEIKATFFFVYSLLKQYSI